MASHALRSTNFRIVRSGYQILPRRWSTTVGTTSSASAASAGSKAAADEWERYKSYCKLLPVPSADIKLSLSSPPFSPPGTNVGSSPLSATIQP